MELTLGSKMGLASVANALEILKAAGLATTGDADSRTASHRFAPITLFLSSLQRLRIGRFGAAPYPVLFPNPRAAKPATMLQRLAERPLV